MFERISDRIRFSKPKTNSMSFSNIHKTFCSDFLTHFSVTNIKPLPLLLLSPNAKPIRIL